MSQQDNFWGGFFLGTMLGGLAGGVLGVLVTNRLSRVEGAEGRDSLSRQVEGKSDRRIPASPQSIEAARRGLEDKIAQLNDAIDDVRQKLGSMNGVPKSENTVPAVGDRKD